MRSASIVAVMAAVLLVSSTRSQETAAPASKDQTDESVQKVKELRKVQAGREIQPNVLKARARRLEAEIHLEEAKMKLAKPIK